MYQAQPGPSAYYCKIKMYQWVTLQDNCLLHIFLLSFKNQQTNQSECPTTIPSNIKGFRKEELSYYDAHIICLADILSPWADQVYFLCCCLLELFDQCPLPARGFQDQDLAWLALAACSSFVITAFLGECNDIACSTLQVVKSGAMLSLQRHFKLWLLYKITFLFILPLKMEG